MRISDWSSDVCSSDLRDVGQVADIILQAVGVLPIELLARFDADRHRDRRQGFGALVRGDDDIGGGCVGIRRGRRLLCLRGCGGDKSEDARSEEHTSELQSLMRISYAVFCLKKKKQKRN